MVIFKPSSPMNLNGICSIIPPWNSPSSFHQLFSKAFKYSKNFNLFQRFFWFYFDIPVHSDLVSAAGVFLHLSLNVGVPPSITLSLNLFSQYTVVLQYHPYSCLTFDPDNSQNHISSTSHSVINAPACPSNTSKSICLKFNSLFPFIPPSCFPFARMLPEPWHSSCSTLIPPSASLFYTFNSSSIFYFITSGFFQDLAMTSILVITSLF